MPLVILALGIGSFIAPLAPVAWYLGARQRRRDRMAGVRSSPATTAGWVLGASVSILFAVSFLVALAAVVIGHQNAVEGPTQRNGDQVSFENHAPIHYGDEEAVE